MKTLNMTESGVGSVGIVDRFFLLDGARLPTVMGVRCLELAKKVSICI